MPQNPRVFILQQSDSRNVEPARAFGEFCVLFDKRLEKRSLTELYNIIELRLDEVVPTGDDYFIMAGQMELIGICSHVVLDRLECLRLLRWNSEKLIYYPDVLDLY